MHIKQVRTKNNAFSTVRYDSAGNILTPARKKELKAQPKKTHKNNSKGPKWIKIMSQYSGLCCVCNGSISISVGDINGAQVDHNRGCCNFPARFNKPACGNCNRGLLCNRCNIALGSFSDNIDLMKNAVNYLEKYST